jgi:nucleotide-binding universal stress UspA family protein
MVLGMRTLRNVVAGTDFSGHAERALALAVDLALAARARITVVHVCELGVDGHDERHLPRCEETLSRVIDEHRRRGADLTGVLRSGKPWEKLDNVAVEVGASLIVVGRRGAGRGRSVGLGTVTDHLLRSASRPVLTVSNDFDAPDTAGDGK